MNQLLLRGFKPDPSICKAGQDYYMVTSSFEFFPSLPIYHSRDLVNWKPIGFCLDRDSQTNLVNVGNSQGMFAPTIRYNNGKFYLVCTNVGGGGNFLVTTTDPKKGWSEPIWLTDWPGIDPSLYFEENRTFIHGTRGWDRDEESGIYLAEIDLETGKLISERKNVWSGTGATDPEGPHLYKKDDWYYLLISEGGTEFGHMLTVARSREIFGPYESFEGNPILTNRSLKNPIQAVGHGDLVEDDLGNWQMVFLAFRCIGYPRQHNLGRETFVTSVDWNEEEWPIISEKNSFELYETEEAMLCDTEQYEFIEEFNKSQLHPYWYFLRRKVKENYQLKDGQLYLRGTMGNLNDSQDVSFLGIPITEYSFYSETTICLKQPSRIEQGISVYVRDDYHYDLFIEIKNNQKMIGLRMRIGNINQEILVQEYEEQSITLFVAGATEKYQFGYIDSYGEKHDIFEGLTRLLSTEVTGGFIGTMIGIYVTTPEETKMNEGVFDSFNYQVKK